MIVYIVMRVEFFSGEKTSEIVAAFSDKTRANNFIINSQAELTSLRAYQPRPVHDPGFRVPPIHFEMPCYEVQEIFVEGESK